MLKEFQTYRGMLIAVAIVIGVGVLVTQGLLDSEYADRAMFLITGGGLGFAVGAKTTPKE